jgi:glucosylceramidase
MKKDKIFIALIIGLLCLNGKCSNKDQPTPGSSNPLLLQQMIFLSGSPRRQNSFAAKTKQLIIYFSNQIQIQQLMDSTITYQTIDGFGYTLTGGSAYLINRLAAAQKTSFYKSCLEAVKIQMQLAIYASVLAHPI